MTQDEDDNEESPIRYKLSDKKIDKVQLSSPPTPTGEMHYRNDSLRTSAPTKIQTTSLGDFSNYKISWNMDEIYSVPKPISMDTLGK